MKVAIPNNDGEVNQHFGRSTGFAIVEINSENRIVDIEEISAEGLQHRHEGLAGLLKNKGVEVVIVGGIGPGALEALESQGFKVLFGASGPIKEVAEAFARGQFISRRTVCNHHGEHHHHHEHHPGNCAH
ncbi:dinitrogenase iron-molybdenum cofactor biosynthesis protein [Thermincola ferriacetica]|uniref:Dinitrogenase iron-molybdenum cofactor biosynthesis protein n=1 Tax=Thermincola ferriacetica TaxID=281456 RepID=A0A0L6W0C9_9FIRM|nr:NifB/NifX family molybdenum-iron cluster-binding protein [Thermincola ferriacetica]KNZ68975.1 dinitrogenase iron-molybdenum cofactor biosynthesis protein [Thermincola ferriacetica]